MTREQAARIVRIIDYCRANTTLPETQRQLAAIQAQMPMLRLVDDNGNITEGFEMYYQKLRAFIQECDELDRYALHSAEFKDGILVIGSCHVDIMGDFDLALAAAIDKPGTVSYGVGGTAYNIANNLRHHKMTVALHTYMPAESVMADDIIRRVRANGIIDRYVVRVPGMPESAFLSHRAGGELVAAVSAMAIEEAEIDADTLDDALEGARVAVIECNLSERQIGLITRLAYRHKIPVIAAGVSQPKARRLLSAYRPKGAKPSILVACMNEREVASVVGPDWASRSNQDICRPISAGIVVVTHGVNGHTVIDAREKGPARFDAPNVKKVVNTTGAGDALISGIIESVWNNHGFDAHDAAAVLGDYVRAALSSVSSTIAPAQPVKIAPALVTR